MSNFEAKKMLYWEQQNSGELIPIEYLTASNALQWCDTWIPAAGDIDMEIDIAVVSRGSSGYSPVAGFIDSNREASLTFSIGGTAEGNTVNRFGSQQDGTRIFKTGLGTRHTFRNGAGGCWRDSEQLRTWNPEVFTGDNLFLGYENNASVASGTTSTNRWYGAKVWRSGVLIANFVPRVALPGVTYADASGNSVTASILTIGFLNVNNGRFYTSIGTEPFAI